MTSGPTTDPLATTSAAAPADSGDAPPDLRSAEVFRQRLADDAPPPWLKSLREEAWARFEALPMPARTDEAWRFSRLKEIDLGGYHARPDPAAADPDLLRARSDQVAGYTGRIVLADDGAIDPGTDLPEDLRRAGVIWSTLQTALRDHSDLVRPHFDRDGTGLGAEKFAALHTALGPGGTFLHVPAGVEVDLPFVAYHWACTGGLALFPRTLVVAGEGARVNLVDLFVSASPDSPNLACARADIVAGPGSKVFYKAVQEWNEETLCFHLNSATGERDANLRSVNVNLGSRYMRHEHHTRLQGPGSNVETYSLSVPTGTQQFDQRTLQTHSAPATRSDLLFKNALSDQSRTIFSGLIRVDEAAQQTDAYQTNRNLVLSPDAESNALPGLEIKANDVKCSHGATSSQLDESDLFYFLARGIPPAQARELMVFGFFEEILEKLEIEELAENVRGHIRKKFTGAES